MGTEQYATEDKAREAQEFMMLDEDLILVDSYRVSFGIGAKIGEKISGENAAYFITLEGRVNGSQERKQVNVMLAPETGFKMADEMLQRLEQVIKRSKDFAPPTAVLPAAFGGSADAEQGESARP